MLWAEADLPEEVATGYELGFEEKYPAFLRAEAAWSQLYHGLLDTGLDVKDNMAQRENNKSEKALLC